MTISKRETRLLHWSLEYVYVDSVDSATDIQYHILDWVSAINSTMCLSVFVCVCVLLIVYANTSFKRKHVFVRNVISDCTLSHWPIAFLNLSFTILFIAFFQSMFVVQSSLILYERMFVWSLQLLEKIIKNSLNSIYNGEWMQWEPESALHRCKLIWTLYSAVDSFHIFFHRFQGIANRAEAMQWRKGVRRKMFVKNTLARYAVFAHQVIFHF